MLVLRHHSVTFRDVVLGMVELPRRQALGILLP